MGFLRTFLFVFLGMGLILLVQPCSVLGAGLRTLKGANLQGKVVSFSANELLFAVGSENKKVPFEEILQIDFEPQSAFPQGPISLVEFTDGSLLHCSKVEILGQTLRFTLGQAPAVETPLVKVSWILFDGRNAKDRATWAERVSKKRKRDVLAVQIKDADTGEGVLNLLEGTLGEASADGKTIDFSTIGAAKPIAVPLANLHALIFQRAIDPAALPVICKVIDTGKSEIQAARLDWQQGQLQVIAASGFAVTLPASALHRLDFSRGKLVFLSDMEPFKVTLSSDQDRISIFKKDMNLDGGPLRINGVVFAKGLALLATTELEYDLKGEYREFSAIAGFDDQVGGIDGTVVLEIEGDGKGLAKMEISRSDKKKDHPVRLNIKDVQKLRIVVRSSVALEFGRHLNLADAQVGK